MEKKVNKIKKQAKVSVYSTVSYKLQVGPVSYLEFFHGRDPFNFPNKFM